jgi:hypothetical protein
LVAASPPELAEEIRTEANYFESNKERMRYPEFRNQGLFVGSGVIEAGCKTVLGRLKQSGMFWTVRGANAIIDKSMLGAVRPFERLRSRLRPARINGVNTPETSSHNVDKNSGHRNQPYQNVS